MKGHRLFGERPKGVSHVERRFSPLREEGFKRLYHWLICTETFLNFSLKLVSGKIYERGDPVIDLCFPTLFFGYL